MSATRQLNDCNSITCVEVFRRCCLLFGANCKTYAAEITPNALSDGPFFHAVQEEMFVQKAFSQSLSLAGRATETQKHTIS